MLASLSNDDLSTILVVVGILALCAAIYVGGWLKNIPGALVLIAVAIIAFLAAD